MGRIFNFRITDKVTIYSVKWPWAKLNFAGPKSQLNLQMKYHNKMHKLACKYHSIDFHGRQVQRILL